MIFLTHKDLSEQSQQILDEFNNQSLLESIKSCIEQIHQEDNDTTEINIFENICDFCDQSPNEYYLEESTTTEKLDPMISLNKQLRHGWKTGGGLTLPITEPPKWDQYEDYSRNVRYKIHSWIILDSLLLVDELSNNDDYLNYALDIADDWIVNYVIKGKKDDFAWYDMAVGQRATKLSYMLRRLISINGDRTMVFRFILAAKLHFSELLDENRIATHSNHGLFQMAGLLSLGENLKFMNSSRDGIDFARKMIKKMLNLHFADDGLHLEHSPDYHLWMINHLESLKNSGWLSSENSSIEDLILSLEESANWMATPNSDVIPIGDTANNVQMIKRWRGYKGEPNIGHRLFPIGGMLVNNSIFKGQSSQLVFSAQFHSRQHKHADRSPKLTILYLQ